MKRQESPDISISTPNGSPLSKRQRTADPRDIFKNESLRRYPEQLLKDEDSSTGYLFGRIHMVWPLVRRRGRLWLEARYASHDHSEDGDDDEWSGRLVRIDVNFTGECAQALETPLVKFTSQDSLWLDLTDAVITRSPGFDAQGTVPSNRAPCMTLTFEHCLKFMKKTAQASDIPEVIDTRDLQEARLEIANDWFATPKKLRVSKPLPPPVPGSSAASSVVRSPVSPIQKEGLEARPENSPSPLLKQLSSMNPLEKAKRSSAKLDSDGEQEEAPPAKKKKQDNRSAKSKDYRDPPPSRHKAANSDTAQENENLDGLSKGQLKKKLKKLKRAEQFQEKQREKQLVMLTEAASSAFPADESTFEDATAANEASSRDAEGSGVGQRQNITSCPLDAMVAYEPGSSGEQNTPVPSLPEDKCEEGGPWVHFAAGLRSQNSRYTITPLSSVAQGEEPSRKHCVIGVVTKSSTPYQSKGSDFTCSPYLGDPSVIKWDDAGCYRQYTHGKRANLFAMSYAGCLPDAREGDVLILRGIAVNKKWGSDNMGIGHRDNLQWIIYSPEEDRFHHGSKKDVPDSEASNNAYGWSYFYDPNPAEKEYAKKIAMWWKAFQDRVEKLSGPSVHIGGGEVPSVTKRPDHARKHRLIKDTGPAVQPNGYFDCTVEVLYGKAFEDNYSLYVTDYTDHKDIPPYSGSWCPPHIVDGVLMIEMSDDAAKRGPDLQVGQYLSIQNARIKIGKTGFLEGRLRENKIKILTESDASYNQNLKDLLERKRDWKPRDVESVPIEEFREFHVFRPTNVVAEVLHIKESTDGARDPLLYCTDYTECTLFADRTFDGSWATGLEGLIAEIRLDQQEVNSIQSGKFYLLKDIFFKERGLGAFQGLLRSSVHMLSSETGVPAYREAIDRIVSRKAELVRKLQQSLGIKVDISRKHFSIREIEAFDKCPNKYRLLGRVDACYPVNVSELVIRKCALCNLEIDSKLKSCARCNDSDSNRESRVFRLFIRLRDAHDGSLLACVMDDCQQLQELARVDLKYDRAACTAYCKALQSLLGLDEQGQFDKTLAKKPKKHEFVVNYWRNENGDRAYGVSSWTLSE